MTTRHVLELSRLYECILTDASIVYPTLRCEFDRDITRLKEAIQQRGINACVVDLPAAGKHLDRCLADGEYKLSGLPLTKRYSNRVVIPKLFRGLYLLIFEASGLLKADYDVEAIFFLRQLLYVGKKTELPCSVKTLESSVQEFFDVDAELPMPHGIWQLDHCSLEDVRAAYNGFSVNASFRNRGFSDQPSHLNSEVSSLLMLLDSVSNTVCTTLGPYSPKEWSFKHGPGAIAETTRPKNKYSWTNWSNRLEDSYPIAEYGFHSYSAWAQHVDQDRAFSQENTHEEITSHEMASRMVSVPKTLTSPRLIAAEPSENQWCQQNLWHYFLGRTEATWIGRFIRFKDQRLNQELCRKGSRDGSLATVDLSSASDRVSCEAVGELFRANPNLIRHLRSARTRFVSQEISARSPQRTDVLRKYSTMGSACTFPIQSILFLCVALTAVLAKRKLQPTLKNIEALEGTVSVFGDDIIVPTDCRVPFLRLMEVLFLRVNTNKTFWTGLFRESCGVDSMGGVSVTPAYWKKPFDGSPESVASVVEVSNNFYKKFLVNTAAYLASTIPKRFNIPKVSMDSGVCGFRSFVNWAGTGHKSRYNQELQRNESLVGVLSCTSPRIPSTDDSGLLQYFTEAPPSTETWMCGYSLKPRLKIRRRWVAQTDLASSTKGV